MKHTVKTQLEAYRLREVFSRVNVKIDALDALELVKLSIQHRNLEYRRLVDTPMNETDFKFLKSKEKFLSQKIKTITAKYFIRVIFKDDIDDFTVYLNDSHNKLNWYGIGELN